MWNCGLPILYQRVGNVGRGRFYYGEGRVRKDGYGTCENWRECCAAVYRPTITYTIENQTGR